MPFRYSTAASVFEAALEEVGQIKDRLADRIVSARETGDPLSGDADEPHLEVANALERLRRIRIELDSRYLRREELDALWILESTFGTHRRFIPA